MQLLRRQIAEHWAPDDPAFREPALDDNERAAIRQQLPGGLADPNRKLRTACGMALAAVARFETPESPELVQQLVAAIDQRDNPHLGELLEKQSPLKSRRSCFLSGTAIWQTRVKAELHCHRGSRLI